MEKGILIAVEGLDGSGKSTQAHLLTEWLRSIGAPVHHTEWNSSPIVKAVTKSGKKSKRLTPETFHLIHAADFADRWEKQIEPMLEVGGVVVCDRYKFTAMARDGARGIKQDRIESCYSFARDPDLTIYFDVSPEIAHSRIKIGRNSLKWYEAGMDMGFSENISESYIILQEKQRKIYNKLVSDGRINRMDANDTISVVQKKLRNLLKQSIDISSILYIDPTDRRSEVLKLSHYNSLKSE